MSYSLISICFVEHCSDERELCASHWRTETKIVLAPNIRLYCRAPFAWSSFVYSLCCGCIFDLLLLYTNFFGVACSHRWRDVRARQIFGREQLEKTHRLRSVDLCDSCRIPNFIYMFERYIDVSVCICSNSSNARHLKRYAFHIQFFIHFALIFKFISEYWRDS